MTELVGCDFETFGSVNLPRHGLARYVRDRHFRPLIASVARDIGGAVVTETFDFVADFEKARQQLELSLESCRIVAHNAPFERAVLASLGLDYPADRFVDSAVVARC